MTGQRANPFLGQWRIVWMELWDQDFIDMEVPGHFLRKEGLGNFQFGLVQDEMDRRSKVIASSFRGLEMAK